MARLGIGEGNEPESIDSYGTTVVLNLPGGLKVTITSTEAGWRKKLIETVATEGYDNVVERVAYTWFNRLIAIRYMEVNDYLPTHVRVLSSIEADKDEPDIVTQCIRMADVFRLSEDEKNEIIDLRERNRTDELFSKMFLYECRSLNAILPELFTETKQYEKLLINLSYTVPDGVVRELVDTIPEEDFRDAVQIIGWMYQYYNSELKDKVFSDLKKNIKISKERIPAATQLFTPDWIVRYMVENSLGRVWLEGHPDDILQSKWKYYLEEAEQEPQVKEKLKELRASRRNMEPTDIRIIDPCMGSGHVLVYAFDVLIQIYESYGYSKQDAASLIVENNIFGLDIDERAYQLAYFAIMMKARSYDSNIFGKDAKPNLHTMVETSDLDDSCLDGYGNGMSPAEKNLAYNDMKYILSSFRDAKTYGSLIKIHGLDYGRIDAFIGSRSSSLYAKDDRVKEAVAVAKVLSKKYDAVITNPPYLGSSGMDAKLSKYVKDCYPDAKSDLFACFIERCMDLTDKRSFTAMITQHAFMFLSSFEKFRHNLIDTKTIVNVAHQGARGFDQIGGEVVQTVAFVVCNNYITDYTGTYCRLVDVNGESAKESKFLSGENRFYVKQSRFDAIPGAPIAYWASQQFIDNFSRGISISSISDFTGSQNKTADNEKYLRFWWEVDYNKIGPGKKWVLYAKGGEARKWYGNIIHVVDWSDEARHFYETNKTSNLLNEKYWYKEGITFTKVSSMGTTFRYMPEGCIFDMGGPAIIKIDSNLLYVLGFLNTSVARTYLSLLNPTINLQTRDVDNLPLIIDSDRLDAISVAVDELIKNSIEDWNENEYSVDFFFIIRFF